MATKSCPEPDHHPAKRIKINNQMAENPFTSTPNQESEPLFFPNFPHELLSEVLSRLPVKNLLKFKCVSKSWLSLISSPQFIKTHLKISSGKEHSLIFTVLPPNSHSHLKQCSVHSALSGPTNAVIDIDYPMKCPDKSFWVVGSCNGLVCITVEENILFLWNPSIRKSKQLPDLGVNLKVGCYFIFGVGYDMLNDDYKVVGISCVFCGGSVCETEVKVYSLKADSWRRIEDFKGGIPLDDPGKYANGKLHWAAGCGFNSYHSWNIVSLDLGSETYGKIERPDYGEGVSNWTFGVLRDRLSVFCDSEKTHGDLWVMKVYGVRDSWSKVVSVPYLVGPEIFRYSMPICLTRNGEILLFFGFGMVVYDSKSNALRSHQINGLEEMNMYVESLVSPNAHDGEGMQDQ